MKKKLSREIPWISLILVYLAYSLLGWHLSPYHPLWSFGTLVVVIFVIATLIWGGKPLGNLFRLGPRSVVTMLLLSSIITIAVAASALFALIILLISTKVFARIQLLCLGYRRSTVMWLISLVATLGMIIGWMFGQFLIPNSSFWFNFSFHPSSQLAGWLRFWG